MVVADALLKLRTAGKTRAENVRGGSPAPR